MRICLFIFLLVPLASAFSELVPSENFTITIDAVVWSDCAGLGDLEAKEVSFTTQEAQQTASQVKQDLAITKLMAQVQGNIAVQANPALYYALGYECTLLASNALKTSLSGTKRIGANIDAEVEKLRFEIGDDFTGPGAMELIGEKEAKEGKGKLGTMAIQLNRDVSTAIAGIYARRPAQAGKTAAWIISQDGVLAKLEKYLQEVKARQAELRELEETLSIQLREKIKEVEDHVAHLKREEVNGITYFEINQLEIEIAKTEISVDEISGETPAGLLGEAEVHLKQAKAQQRRASEFREKGRTAKRINSLEEAIQEIEKADAASRESQEKTTTILRQLEKIVIEKRGEAEQIDKPFAKTLAQSAMEKLRYSGTYRDKIMQLTQVRKTLENIQKIQAGEVEDTDKLKLKIELRDLQRTANAAEKNNVNGAGEIASEVKNIYSQVDSISSISEFLSLEDQAVENRQLLNALIEDKFNYLHELYKEATDLEGESAFTDIEEKTLGDMREVFTGPGQLARNIESVNEIEETLKKLVQTGLKRASEGSTIKTQPLEYAQNSTFNHEVNYTKETIDVKSILAELEETRNAGINAFHSDERIKKSIESIKFENALKVAQRKASELEKTPTVERATELRKYIAEMKDAIQETGRKAGLEIAIAEERNADITSAAKKWEDGKFTEALLEAQKKNREKSEAAMLTGEAPKGDDSKMWAVGISLVIILIGAAYLFYVKKKDDQQPV